MPCGRVPAGPLRNKVGALQLARTPVQAHCGTRCNDCLRAHNCAEGLRGSPTTSAVGVGGQVHRAAQYRVDRYAAFCNSHHPHPPMHRLLCPPFLILFFFVDDNSFPTVLVATRFDNFLPSACPVWPSTTRYCPTHALLQFQSKNHTVGACGDKH